ncbi:hypothetical protein BU16DRAFT_559080 [Lophium mytilinum]|uniref:Uncharacterized protein n=1 Tax=Lophium mytilinum TaxID=390894 RepID=A0A6A6R1Q4_9PEZI|nr:hypothetical protein BU16DRAFT_559080 [Lophium mytilinum]
MPTSIPMMVQAIPPSATLPMPETFEERIARARRLVAQNPHHPAAERLRRYDHELALAMAVVRQSANSLSTPQNPPALAEQTRLPRQLPAVTTPQHTQFHAGPSTSQNPHHTPHQFHQPHQQVQQVQQQVLQQQVVQQNPRQIPQQIAASQLNIRPAIPWSCPNGAALEMHFNHDSSPAGAGVFLRTKAGFVYYLVRRMALEQKGIFHVPEHLKVGLPVAPNKVLETYVYLYRSWYETSFRHDKPAFEEYYLKNEEGYSRLTSLYSRIGAAQDVLAKTLNALEAKKAFEAEPCQLPLNMPMLYQISRPQLPDRIDEAYRPCAGPPPGWGVCLGDIERPLAAGEVHSLPPWEYLTPEDLETRRRPSPPRRALNSEEAESIERASSQPNRTRRLSSVPVRLTYNPLPPNDDLTDTDDDSETESAQLELATFAEPALKRPRLVNNGYDYMESDNEQVDDNGAWLLHDKNETAENFENNMGIVREHVDGSEASPPHDEGQHAEATEDHVDIINGYADDFLSVPVTKPSSSLIFTASPGPSLTGMLEPSRKRHYNLRRIRRRDTTR